MYTLGNIIQNALIYAIDMIKVEVKYMKKIIIIISDDEMVSRDIWTS